MRCSFISSNISIQQLTIDDLQDVFDHLKNSGSLGAFNAEFIFSNSVSSFQQQVFNVREL